MKQYLVILVSFLALDGLWLGVIMKSFYRKHLGFLFADSFAFVPAGIFYLLYGFGVWFFVVSPALASGSPALVLGRGALLGLIVYAAYDLTNQATIARWPVLVTLTDMAWGAVVTAVVSLIAYLIFR